METIEKEKEQAAEDYLESEIQLIIFTINNIEYALNISNIIEVIKLKSLAPLPNAPDFIKGVINLRNKVIPILDLRERFQSPVIQKTRRTTIMIASIQDKDIGLIADSVMDVIGLNTAQIEPPLPIIHGLKMEYIKGIARLNKRLVILVNIEKILSSQERNILQEAINE